MRSMHALLLGLCAVVLAAAPAIAQEPFYKGKRLTMLINFAAGGPTDIEGRIFAKYLVKHIDGQPNIVVQTLDGAGGLVGAAYLGEVAVRDGTHFGYLTGTAWLHVSEPERWRVDFKSYEFIAYQPGTTVHFMRADVPPGMKEPADIVKAQGLIAGGQSLEISKDIRMRMGLDMLGVPPYKYVTGYRSSPAGRLAVQRGEIHMFSESPPSYRAAVVPQLVTPGIAIPVWFDDVSTADPPPPQKQMEGLAIPSLPQLYRKVKGRAPSGQLWEAYKTLFEVNSRMQRLVVLPPNTPRAAFDAISKAIERLSHDKDFAAEAVKTIEFVPEYVTSPTMSETVRGMLHVSPEMRRFINEYTRNVPKN
jgi:tripartite-type tricarboxylate transporter receptor subunit TctC